MDNFTSSSIALYFEIFLIFLCVVIAAVLYVLVRSFIRRVLIPKGKAAGILLSRLSVPIVFLIVSLILKIEVVRTALFPSRRFHSYFDAALVFFFIVFLIRLVDGILLGWHERRRVEFPLPKVLHSLILAVLYLTILFIIFKGQLGINITPFLATSAILTMILGLAFQGVLSNILAGMSLTFTKSFNKNDWIRVGENEGMVLDTNWRETRIFDRYSNIIVLPNNIVASENITNYSQPNRRTALTVPVKASYDAPPSKVLDALRDAASEVPQVLSTPAPEAYVLGYEDFGISYVLKFWITDFAHKYPIMTTVGRLIWYKFQRQGIEIPVPVSDKLGEVLRSVREQAGIPLPDMEKERNFYDLMRSSFLRYQEGEKRGFLLVSEDEIRELAVFAKRHRFTSGEYVFRQGEKGESCYILASGRIKGEIIYEEKGKKYTSEFFVEPGGLFGEMSLFTGMPRTATGLVEVESELLEIDTEDFSRILGKNPKLAEIMADLVSKRNKKNQEFLKKIKELSEQDIKISTSKRSILSRLKNLILRKQV
jgi:small-conductance mechanosensitive channel/CRP-like cAMP-binding protein